MGHRLVSSGQIGYAFPRRDGLKRRPVARRRCRPAEKARRARDVPIEPRGNPMENAAPDSMFVQWQRFMAGQEVDRRIVKPMVYDSWVRSRAYGVRHDRRPEGRVDDARLAELLAANSEFIESSKVIMAKLFTAVEDANSVISLTDSQGVVLHTHVHSNRGHLLPGHMPGFIFSERICGTNGIGTCLHCAAPVELVGAEHYCAHDHVWYCSAAPIFDSKANLLGVFNISISRESFHHHTRGMVEAAAHAITEQVCLRELLSEQAAIMELLDEGLIVVNHEGLLKSISQKACAILGIPRRRVPSTSARSSPPPTCCTRR